MEDLSELLEFGVFNRLQWVSIMISLNRTDQSLLDKEEEGKARKESAELFRSRKPVVKLTGWEALTKDMLK